MGTLTKKGLAIRGLFLESIAKEHGLLTVHDWMADPSKRSLINALCALGVEDQQ